MLIARILSTSTFNQNHVCTDEFSNLLFMPSMTQLSLFGGNLYDHYPNICHKIG